MDGFVTAAAFIITSTQLQNLLGLTFEKDNVFFVQVCAASVLHLWHNKGDAAPSLTPFLCVCFVVATTTGVSHHRCLAYHTLANRDRGRHLLCPLLWLQVCQGSAKVGPLPAHRRGRHHAAELCL